LNDPRREKYQAVFDRLNEMYGEPIWHSHGPPLDELVGTILSQATADTNTERAYVALRA
jgi:endonuclease III